MQNKNNLETQQPDQKITEYEIIGMQTDPKNSDNSLELEKYRDSTMRRSVTRNMLELARSGNVLFCPGCVVDWQPLLRMTDVVRCFVFCTTQTYPETFEIFDPESCPSESLRPLLSRFTCDSVDGDLMRDAGITSFRKGKCAKLRRKSGVKGVKFERELTVASLNADPGEVYRMLFPANGPGPKFLCLLHANSQNSVPGDAVLFPDAAPARYIIDAENSIRAPWLRCWQTYPEWNHAMIFQRRDQQPHGVQEPLQLENFSFTSDPIRPEFTGLNHAVHLTLQQYMTYQWAGQDRCILLDAPPEVVTAIQAVDARVQPLRLLGRPLGEALPALAGANISPNCKTVHTGRLGLEDEANRIGPTWSARFAYRKLVVHCEHEWDHDAVVGYVDDDLAVRNAPGHPAAP